jgi:hypothetical protein
LYEYAAPCIAGHPCCLQHWIFINLPTCLSIVNNTFSITF